MRCFLAVELSEEARNELSKVQKTLDKGNIKAKFVEPENLHLTLKFFGELTDNQVGKIKEALKGIKFESFKVGLSSVGVFPSRDYIRVVWVDLEPKVKLVELHSKIEEALSGAGFRADKREFQTHVTLARVKSVKDKKSFVKDLGEIKVGSVVFEVKDFVLKKSALTSEGPVYEDIVRFTF